MGGVLGGSTGVVVIGGDVMGGIVVDGSAGVGVLGAGLVGVTGTNGEAPCAGGLYGALASPADQVCKVDPDPTGTCRPCTSGLAGRKIEIAI
jgi:hypothetical protein